MKNFIQADPNQPLLLPIDLREWVPADDMVHFVLEAVAQVPLARFHVNVRGSGSKQYHPRMMLALLVYCYANGVFGSRRIEAATYRDIAVRYLCADTHPDHDTICKFRRENLEALRESFVQVLELARELKLLKVGTISVDGTKLDANASKHRNVRYDRAGELIGQLEADIGALLDKAELGAGRKRLEEEAKARAAREQGDYEGKVAARDQRKGRRKGKKIKPPDDRPPPSAQSNLSDPDSSLMRKNKGSEYRQSYNAQAAVSADGSYLILGNRVSRNAADGSELVADVESVPKGLGRVSGVLADNGFANGDQVDELERRDMEVLVATGRNNQRRYDFRPPKPAVPRAADPKPWIQRMNARLESDRGRALYRLRQQTVEPVFGIIKQVMGFRRFTLRGLEKVSGEWQLVCLAYNCKRLHRLIQAA